MCDLLFYFDIIKDRLKFDKGIYRLIYSHKIKSAGFTLIELIVIIVLISIIAITAAPRFTGSSSFDSSIIREMFISQLRKTQMLAINNTDRCYRLSVNGANYSTLYSDNINCTGTFNKVETQQLPKETDRLLYNSNEKFDLDFYNDGSATVVSQSYNCTQDNENDSLCITVKSEEAITVVISKGGLIYAK